MKYPQNLLLAALLSSLAAQVMAADDSFQTEDDLLNPIPVVHSVTRLKQKISDIPAAVTVIDREMIRATGAINIADIMRLVPGFQVYHVNANVFGITSHGQGEAHNSRLEVMIDGRSIYLPLLSTVDWSALGIGIEDIDRIEVVRGPNVPTQGSNAFLGSINIVTRVALQDQGLQLGTTQGALGTHEYYLRQNGQIGSLDYRVSANYHTNGGTGMGFEDGNPALSASRIEDGGQIRQLFWSGVYTPNLTDNFNLQLGYSNGEIGIGSATSPDEYNPRGVYSHFQDLRWTRALSDTQSLQIHAYHNYHKWRETDLLFVPAGFGGLGLPDFTIDLGVEDGTTERYDLAVEYKAEPWQAARLVTGIGLRSESLHSPPLLGTDKTVRELSYRLFSNLEWKPSYRWTLNAGAMLEINNLIDNKLSPRLAANFHVTPLQTLRATVSRAYRTPSLLEAYQYTAIILPNDTIFDVNVFTSGELKPEKVTNYELGYMLRSPGIDASFDFKLFLEDAERGINGIRVINGNFTSIDNQNSMHWETRGWEVQWKLRPWQHTGFYLAYANARASGEQPRGLNRKTEHPDDHIPHETLALMTTHRLSPSADASLTFYRMSNVEWLSGSVLDAYDRLDLRLAKRFTRPNWEARLELIVQNLLSPYTEFETNNLFDTRTFLRMNVNFL